MSLLLLAFLMSMPLLVVGSIFVFVVDGNVMVLMFMVMMLLMMFLLCSVVVIVLVAYFC